jgi:RNA polymerase sigma-70 factor (ECF subfamily)
LPRSGRIAPPCQETFLSLIRSIRRFRGESQFTTWLFRVAINVCLKRRRGIWDPAPGQELCLDELLPSRDTGGRLELADWSGNADRTLRAIAASPAL